MFERYTEKARRVIFFARYEASQFGSPYIETEHLLLGIVREDKAIANRFIRSHISVEYLRKEIQQHASTPENSSTSVDLPLANESKRALFYASEEAERLRHPHIGTEHLLLGLLRETTSLASKLLIGHGLRIDPIRLEIARQPHESPADIPGSYAATHAAPVEVHTAAEGVHAVAKGIHTVGGGVQSAAMRTRLRPPDPHILIEKAQLLRSVRIWLSVVIVGLVLSGITAFPLQTETTSLVRTAARLNLPQHAPTLNAWLVRVASALADTNTRYPFLAYGTDWLAFAHLVIAAAFIGPWLDPVRNKWFITWGFLSCAAVPFLAFIAGPIRGIPLYWRCIDSSFGLFCCLALLALRRSLKKLEAISPYKP